MPQMARNGKNQYGNPKEKIQCMVCKVFLSPGSNFSLLDKKNSSKGYRTTCKSCSAEKAEIEKQRRIQNWKYRPALSMLNNSKQRAKRNNIEPTDYEIVSMLFAIRRGEGGRRGRQFGVLTPAAMEQPGDTDQQTLDRQAGWAASILNKRKNEWSSMPVNEQSKYQGFHHYLQTKYAPHGVKNDPTGLNKNWLNNFKTHYNEHIGFLQ